VKSIYILGSKNEKTGPFTVGEINLKLKNGEINSDCSAWFKDHKEWKPLKSASFLNLGVRLIDEEMPPPWDFESIKKDSQCTNNESNKKPDMQSTDFKVLLEDFLSWVIKNGPSFLKKILNWIKKNPKLTAIILACYLMLLIILGVSGFVLLDKIGPFESSNKESARTGGSGGGIDQYVGWYKGTAENDAMDGNAFLKIFKDSTAELKVYFYKEHLGETLVTNEFTCDGRFYQEDGDWFFDNNYDGRVYEVDFSSSKIEMEGEDIEFEFERE
jgi:hypothetical protein